MLFSSNVFLFLFLPAVLIGCYLLPWQCRNPFLLAASLVFYAWAEPGFLLIMAASILFNYLLALLIAGTGAPKVLLLFDIAGNLALLFSFKYLDFFLYNVNRLGFAFSLPGLALPLGISFFTFQAMSYVIDVYRGEAAAERNLITVALYVAFFPQLVAGPIVRFQDIAPQLRERKPGHGRLSTGVHRFLIGLGKKIILANNLALIADHAFGLPDAGRSVSYAWLGAIAYSLQILFDFSGYSDMAIGLGAMFGFRFPENFDRPYLSASVSEFWRRWHMTLGQWFRDYVYFPLGGSRVPTKGRLAFNLALVWLLTGFWHGAGWNFILWGALYFFLIAGEKLTGFPVSGGRLPAALYRLFTLLAILCGWVLFRAETLSAAAGYLQSMLPLPGRMISCSYFLPAFRDYWLFLLAALVCVLDLPRRTAARFERTDNRLLLLGGNIFRIAFYAFLFIWSVSFLILDAHNPFIYFNF